MQPVHEVFEVSVNGSQTLKLNGDTLDFIPTGADSFHVLLDGKRYQAVVQEANYSAKTFRIKVNGSLYEVKLADRFDQLVEQLGLSRRTITKIQDIKAPMPGMVLEI